MQLHIPQPCPASWEHMQPTEKGRHCAACAKQVIDFTGMTDAEVLACIQSAAAPVCGRVAPGQLDREIIPGRSGLAIGWRRLPYGIGWLLALLLGYNRGEAQVKPDSPFTMPPPPPTLSQPLEGRLGGLVMVGKPIASRTVRLTITDKKGEPLNGASVVPAHSKAGVISDAHGVAVLHFPADKKRVILQVYYVGYVPKTIKVNLAAPTDQAIAVRLDIEDRLMGDVVVVGGVTTDD